MKQWEVFLAVMALIGGIWNHIRALGSWFRSFFVTSVWVDTDVAQLMTSYLESLKAPKRAGESVYMLAHWMTRFSDQAQVVLQQQMYRSSAVYWVRSRPLWCFKAQTPLEEGLYEIKFSYFRGLDWEQLLIDAATWKNSKPIANHQLGYRIASICRFEIYYHHGKSLTDDDGAYPGDPRGNQWLDGNGCRLLNIEASDLGTPDDNGLSTLVLSQELQNLVMEIHNWFESKSWCKERHVPWRRSYLFTGIPGTGKSSFVRSIAQDMDLPVHVLDLASMANQDLRAAWKEIVANTPCIVLMEDIDAVFEGRENISTGGGMASSGGLTFDALLNCMDGVERASGILTFVTSNHPENIDSALLERPGRIDRIVEFLPLNYQGRLKLAQTILRDDVKARQEAMEGDGETAAQFTERCCRLALAEKYSDSPYR